MAEFATEWTPALVAEFNRYDLNHDGIITAAECLKVEGSASQGEIAREPSSPLKNSVFECHWLCQCEFLGTPALAEPVAHFFNGLLGCVGGMSG